MICLYDLSVLLTFLSTRQSTKAHEVSARSGRGQTPPDDFRRTGEEEQLGELYGLDDAQLYWRRLKIGELRSESLFRREYPFSSHDDFVAADWDSFIRPELVMNARREDVGEPFGDLIVGIDPAAQGADSTGGGSWGGLRFPTK